MARRFLDDIRTDIANEMADNVLGDITPAIMRARLNDLIDSTIGDEADLFSTSSTAGIVLTGTFASLATIYDAEAGGDGDFLNTAFAAGTITGTSTPGFTYTIAASITVMGANNEEIEFAIGINGVAGDFFATLVGDGLRAYSVSLIGLDRSASASAVYTLMARASDGAATITVDAVRLVVVIQPTNNP